MRSNSSTSASKWIALFISFLTTVIMFISYVGYTPLVPEIMDDLQIGYTEAGWLASISTISGGITVLFAGATIDRFGPKLVILVGLGILVVGQVATALAATFGLLLFARAILGLGIALLLVAPYTMAMRWFESSNGLGLAMGVMLSTDGIGAAFGLYLWASGTASLGWRTQAWVGALVIALTVALVAFLLRESPHSGTAKGQALSLRNVFQDYPKVLRNRNVWSAAIFLSGIWGSYSIAVFWMPTILIEEAGWSESLSGFVSSLYALAGIVTGIIFGLISDRMGKRRPFILISGVATTVAFVVVAITLQSTEFFLFALMMPIAGLFAYIGLPLSYVLAADSVGIRSAATANGIALGIGFLVGATLFPLLLGAIKDTTGSYTLGFILVAASQLLCNVVAPWFLARDARQPRTDAKSPSALADTH